MIQFSLIGSVILFSLVLTSCACNMGDGVICSTLKIWVIFSVGTMTVSRTTWQWKATIERLIAITNVASINLGITGFSPFPSCMYGTEHEARERNRSVVSEMMKDLAVPIAMMSGLAIFVVFQTFRGKALSRVSHVSNRDGNMSFESLLANNWPIAAATGWYFWAPFAFGVISFPTTCVHLGNHIGDRCSYNLRAECKMGSGATVVACLLFLLFISMMVWLGYYFARHKTSLIPHMDDDKKEMNPNRLFVYMPVSFLLAGLKSKYWYWDIVTVLFRGAVYLVSNSLASTGDLYMRGITTSLFCIMTGAMAAYWHPYHDDSLNTLQILSLFAAACLHLLATQVTPVNILDADTDIAPADADGFQSKLFMFLYCGTLLMFVRKLGVEIWVRYIRPEHSEDEDEEEGGELKENVGIEDGNGSDDDGNSDGEEEDDDELKPLSPSNSNGKQHQSKEYGITEASETDLASGGIWIPDAKHLAVSRHHTVEGMRPQIAKESSVHTIHAAVPGGILDQQAKVRARLERHQEARQEAERKRERKKGRVRNRSDKEAKRKPKPHDVVHSKRKPELQKHAHPHHLDSDSEEDEEAERNQDHRGADYPASPTNKKSARSRDDVDEEEPFQEMAASVVEL